MFSNKDLRKLIIPLVIEQLLAVTIGMADTVMVSSCGEAAVSGISLVDSINFLLITLFSSLATGGAVIASQYIGRGDHKSASLAAKQLFYASLALSAVLGVIVWPLAFALPNALRAANDVRFTMIVSLLSMWIFRIGFSYILAIYFNMGILGTWIAMCIDWFCRGACFVIRFARGKWKNISFIDN